jgi:hypothetical protein
VRWTVGNGTRRASAHPILHHPAQGKSPNLSNGSGPRARPAAAGASGRIDTAQPRAGNGKEAVESQGRVN